MRGRLRLTVLRGIHSVADGFYDEAVDPSPEPVVPARRRLPDWAFAAGLFAASLILLVSLFWAPDPSGFLEPMEGDDAETELPEHSGYFAALEDLRPEEEQPDASLVAVEEFGHVIGDSREGLSWGAAVRNTHTEYGVTFDLQVTAGGAEFLDSERYTSISSGPVLPGAQIMTGADMPSTLPADATVEIEVVGVKWFAFDGAEPPAPQEPVLSSRIDAFEVPADNRGPEFSVTFTNGTGYAIERYFTAVYYLPDGTPVGAEMVIERLTLPPGESSRDLRLWDRDVPAGADLSLTQLVPTW